MVNVNVQQALKVSGVCSRAGKAGRPPACLQLWGRLCTCTACMRDMSLAVHYYPLLPHTACVVLAMPGTLRLEPTPAPHTFTAPD